MAAEPELDEDKIRDDLVRQLQESLALSWEMMMNSKLDLKARERWTQINTNTAQVLNHVLKDRQFRDWERRLKELEGFRRERDAAGAYSRTAGSLV